MVLAEGGGRAKPIDGWLTLLQCDCPLVLVLVLALVLAQAQMLAQMLAQALAQMLAQMLALMLKPPQLLVPPRLQRHRLATLVSSR